MFLTSQPSILTFTHLSVAFLFFVVGSFCKGYFTHLGERMSLRKIEKKAVKKVLEKKTLEKKIAARKKRQSQTR
jgi:hypothetical protein